MKHLKKYESYFKNPDEGPKYDGSSDDVTFEKITWVTVWFKHLFNFINDTMKNTTGTGLDLSNGVIDGFTGNQYSNISSLVDDSTAFGDNLENLYFEDANIHTSNSGKKFQYYIELENVGEMEVPEFDEDKMDWTLSDVELEPKFGLLFEDYNEGDGEKIHLPKDLKTFNISKNELESALKIAFQWVKDNY
jgi:hypothetical protein